SRQRKTTGYNPGTTRGRQAGRNGAPSSATPLSSDRRSTVRELLTPLAEGHLLGTSSPCLGSASVTPPRGGEFKGFYTPVTFVPPAPPRRGKMRDKKAGPAETSCPCRACPFGKCLERPAVYLAAATAADGASMLTRVDSPARTVTSFVIVSTLPSAVDTWAFSV